MRLKIVREHRPVRVLCLSRLAPVFFVIATNAGQMHGAAGAKRARYASRAQNISWQPPAPLLDEVYLKRASAQFPE
jgi:hypothetical protein